MHLINMTQKIIRSFLMAFSLKGFAEDDCIDIDFDSEGFSDQAGADGRVVRY